MYPRSRGKANSSEVGFFMFFAWLLLVIVAITKGLFTLIGILFEQVWFLVLITAGLTSLIITLIVLTLRTL